jgi:hypothetical protein
MLACARQGTITGGPKDTTPPVLDTLGSTPNYATRFVGRYIELRFDEWLTLKDAAQQVVISPPLAKNPKVTLDGKVVKVDLGEDPKLRPNTTYTLNFGGAVTDFHEGNPVKDLRFVFATGDVIDSLEVRGTVFDAATDEPVENATVMLYDVVTDSIPLREKPYYFARTDKTGQFKIQNIRAGQFKCVAIDEGNAPDLRWNGSSERVAFEDSPLMVSDSTQNQPGLRLRLFKTEPRLQISDRSATRYGLIRLAYTRTPPAPDSLAFRASEAALGVRFLLEKSQDSVLVWYDWPADATPVAWHLLSGERDSTPIKALSRADFLTKNKVQFAGEAPAPRGKSNRTAPTPTAPASGPPPIKTVVQNPARPAMLAFVQPLVRVDTARWVLTRDSTTRVSDYSVRIDSSSTRQLVLDASWQAGQSYTLLLLPGAVTDFWGTSNVDTLRRVFNVLGEKTLGGLVITAQSLVPGRAYVLQLLSGSNTLELERRFVANGTEQRIALPSLAVSAYSIRLIDDRNSNGRWDTGDYFGRRQPEAIFNKKLESLRANWEVEATIEAVENTASKRIKQLNTEAPK